MTRPQSFFLPIPMAADSTKKGRLRPRRPSTHFPVRKRRGSYLTVTGKFTSPKNKHMVLFEGLRERDFCLLLDYDPDVQSFQDHPVTISYRREGRKCRYTPDMLVHYRMVADGKPVRRPELCEVKVRDDLRANWKEYRARFRAAQAYCREKGWRFRVVDERTLRRPMITNLHFLWEFRRRPPLPEVEAAVYQVVQRNPGAAVQDLAESAA